MKRESDNESLKVASEEHILEALFKRWSSHPASLKKQRVWLFVIGLVPVIAVVAFIVYFLSTGLSGFKSLIENWDLVCWSVVGALSLSLGLVFSFALLNLIARSRLATKTNDQDRIPFPRSMVVLFSFFWVIPALLSFLQSYCDVQLVSPKYLYVLNALCFAPFVLLLIWVRFSGWSSEEEEKSKPRRPLWFILGTLFLGLAGLSWVGDLQVLAHKLHLSSAISGLEKLTVRVAALATLLPLSMICYSIWLLFRRTMTKEEEDLQAAEDASKEVKKKSFWRRFLDWLRGCRKKTEEPALKTEDKPPEWLSQLCSRLPEGVTINSKDSPNPDRLPSHVTPMSPPSSSHDADYFWMLMGGEEGRRPTELQMQFFRRFRDSVEEAWQAAAKGNDVSPDIILSGDEGTGRTEALLAAAFYAAFVRRQRVLYLVFDSNQAKTLSDKANRRFSESFLNCFLCADTLDGKKASGWVEEIKSNGEKKDPNADCSNCVPPNILFATPRDVERIFFEGCGVDASSSSIQYLRDILRLFEVVLVDDFMEFDVTERAHLPFILHKLRLILISGNLRPQFVVVTPRLRDDDCVHIVAERLFGSGFNLAGGGAGNAITLLPRECEPAWSLPLVVKDGLDIGSVCERLIKDCMELATDEGEKLKVVLYRKGLHPHQCEELVTKIAPEEHRRDLQVVSRLDEIDTKSGADAVFYLTALAGRADMALRLSVGDGRTVYISLSSESEAILGDDGGPRILPAIPDSTAVALRIHHLRSLLRFITPGQPIATSAWERFGVFISSRIRTGNIPEGEVIHEIWRQDEWTEPAYGQPPLWPYVAFEGNSSVKSNAGRGTNFGVLPYTDEDIVRLGDEPLMGLIRPQAYRNGRVENAGIGIGSLAKWIDSQDIPRGVIDLAHAETLVFGRSALGDVYSTASGASDTVFTVKSFEAPSKDDAGCVCNLRMTPWKGDGMDFDMPIRSISWVVEPVSVPHPTGQDPAKAFTFFDMPDCRDLPRIVSGTIVGRVNRIGQSIDALEDESVRRYSYKAYLSGLLLVPRKLDSKDGIAQIQRGVVGEWSTNDDSFSVVLTHLFTGVLIRIVPDLPFYASFPVFHQYGKDSAVAAAVAWIVQPLDSGKTVEDLLHLLFLRPECQATLKNALSEAWSLFSSRPDPASKLRWLRSFSRSAFAFDLSDPGALEAFERDIDRSNKVISVLAARISGTLAEIEEFSTPVPDIDKDHRWIFEAKTIDPSVLQSNAKWTERIKFPDQPKLGLSGVTCRWHFRGKEYSLSAGFEEADGIERFKGFLDNSFEARISSDSYTEYGSNDPYHKFFQELCEKLRRTINETIPKATATQIAEFLLSFVQEGLPYVLDPTDKKSDWPRHPSETILRFGGDCEDTSILYAELLRYFRIGNAILAIPQHAAVGVEVPMTLTSEHQKPIVYSWLGRSYVYAETATNCSATPLGAETNLIKSTDDIPATVIPTPELLADGTMPIRILNAVGPNSGSLEITLVAPEGTSNQLSVAVFARPRKAVFDAPDQKLYPCVGGVLLPPLASNKVFSTTINLRTPNFPSWWYDVFVCNTDTGVVRGHFVGVAHFKK